MNCTTCGRDATPQPVQSSADVSTAGTLAGMALTRLSATPYAGRMVRGALVTAWLFAWLATAQELALVPIGSGWRWQPASDSPGTFPEHWREVDFDDRAWPRGPSGFTTFPWGGEASVIAPFPATNALCLRGRFELSDPAGVTWLVLRADWSGGFVAYLNGREILRRNLPGNPGDPVPFGAEPTPHGAGLAEELDCSPAVAELRPGDNVLALQWHPPRDGFGGRLVPELLANFTRGPFVQGTTPSSQTVVWRTPTPASTEVELGESPEALRAVFADSTPTTNHVATLTDLMPDTQYWYRVVSRDGGRVAASPVLQFRTFKAAGPLRFVVAADVGGGALPQYQVAAVMRDAAPDLVLIAGDLVYPRFLDRLADQRFFSVYRGQMTHTPFFVVAGNHDTTYGWPWEFVDAFVCPTNDTDAATLAGESTWPEAYYSFDCGDAHFIGLYVPILYAGLELRPGKAQWRWLEADLAASRKPWKFIFLHHPLMSSGPHGRDDYNFNNLADMAELAGVLLPLARRYGVQMIFSGHDHAYERFRPVQGVHCLVTGGGGGALYPQAGRDPASAQFHYRWHCVQVDVAGESLHLRAVDGQGVVFDEMFIQRAPPPPAIHPATWHTPVFDPEPAAADGDGNFTGQRFDFAGSLLPARPGEYSNPGRCWVNHDNSHLYLGFAGVMLPDDGNLFVFLESPALPGVTSLAGLGNGVVDPEGEGVDGLDFLENLAFANFRPAFAAVVGDEFADVPARGFWRTNIITGANGVTVRTNLALPIGQGVFRLAPGFPEVPGVRLQQFNRSPQTGPVPDEQNADFILLVLPLAELGLRGDEVIRLGAVVGLGGYSTNAAEQTRELDTAFLGARLDGQGQGPVVLEGVSVRLGEALDPEADPDGDGMSTGAELLAGTDPRDPASVLRLAAQRRPDRQLELTWPAVPGRTYHLEVSLEPGGPFVEITDADLPRRATRAQEQVVLPAETNDTPRYFRLKLAP